MKKILILMGRYLPGHKDGGPLRTMINLTDALGDEYEFRIAALDRDHGDTEPYQNIKMDIWNTVGKTKVWYVQPGGFTFALIRTLTKEVDLVYTCGFYNDYGYKTLMLNRLNLLYGKPVVVASMGTFSEGALSHKATKKKVFIRLLKMLGMFRDMRWSVTSELEQTDVKNNVGSDAKCVIAEDLPRFNVPGLPHRREEILKVAFLSRICPQKNLLYAIKIMEKVHRNAFFTVYGPAEDQQYWHECQKELEMLPPNVQWEYEGDVPSEDVQKMLSENDVFLFPTKGENYGHVIFEALSVGCIPVISDQTPWSSIGDTGSGYVLPLNDMSTFAKVIDEIVDMSVDKAVAMQRSAISLAQGKVHEANENTGYRKLFDLQSNANF